MVRSLLWMLRGAGVGEQQVKPATPGALGVRLTINRFDDAIAS